MNIKAENAAEVIKGKTGLEEVLVGAMYDDSLGDRLKVTLIAAGFGRNASQQLLGFDKSISSEALAVRAASQFSAAYIAYRESNWEGLDRPPFQHRRAGLH